MHKNKQYSYRKTVTVMAVYPQLCGYRDSGAPSKLLFIYSRGAGKMSTLILRQGEVMRLSGQLPQSMQVMQGRIWISYCGQDVILGRTANWQPGKAAGEILLLEAVGGPATLALKLAGQHAPLLLASCN